MQQRIRPFLSRNQNNGADLNAAQEDRQKLAGISPGFYPITSDCNLMIFKGNIICYILLLKSPLTLENTKFIAGEFSLMVSLMLYLHTGHYEP